MDDYYSIIGVDAGASSDDIKSAYRDRKAAISAMSGGTAKTDAVKLNKAFNVLSDPYQRGRYDEQRAQALEDGTMEIEDDISTNGDGAKSKTKTGDKEAPVRGRKRELPPPTIQPPPGTRYPQPKVRVIALVIDVAVLIALFTVSQFILVQLEKSQQPDAYKDKQELVNHTLPDAQKKTSEAKKQYDAVKNGTDQNAIAAKKAAYEGADGNGGAKAAEKTISDRISKDDEKLTPIANLVTGVFFIIAALYLIIPSALTGRTLGKRFQHLRAIRDNGEPLGWMGATRRYGLLVLATYALSFLLGPVAAVIVLFGVFMWMRNPNQQGIHDRLTHTLVVEDVPQ